MKRMKASKEGAGEDTVELMPILGEDKEGEVQVASEMAAEMEECQNEHTEAANFSGEQLNQYPSKSAERKAKNKARKKEQKKPHVIIDMDGSTPAPPLAPQTQNQITDMEGSTPVPPLARQTQNQDSQRSQYHFAAHLCNFLRVKKLQKKGTIDIEHRDNRGANCLNSLVSTQFDEKIDDNFEKIRKTFDALLPQEMDGKVVKAMLENEDKYKYSAMERAAFLGKSKTLRLFLDRYVEVTSSSYPMTGSPEIPFHKFPVTSEGRTLLHSAASAGQTEIAQDLLDRWPEMIDVKDSEGSTALHMAANYRHDSVVILFIEHGASLSELDKGGEPALLLVMCISNAREGVLKRLDQSLSFEDGADGPYKKRHKIKIDFKSTILNVDKELPESYVLSRIAELDLEITEKLLLHPVCKTFVELKLQRLRAFCYSNILFYFTFLGLFTALCIESGVVPIFFSDQTRETGDNITSRKEDNITSRKDDNIFLGMSENSVLSTVTTVFASICMLRRVYFVGFYISALRKKRTQSDVESSVPMRNFETKGSEKHGWGLFCEIVGILVFAWTISVIWFRDTSFVQHSVSFLLLIFWCKSVFLFEVFPSCGKYIMMLKAVLLTFSKIFTIFIPLLVGFVLAFCVIFRGTFSIPKNLSTMLAMIMGEYNEKDIFSNPENYLSFTGHIIFIFFILILSIVLINLWVGLSVSDVSSLALISEIRLAKSNIERLRLAEELSLFVKHTFCGLAVFWEQMNVFSNNGTDHGKNDNGNGPPDGVSGENYGIIDISLKKPDKKDLLPQNPKSEFKKRIRESGAYNLFRLGIVFYNTSLHRKHPIGTRLQDQLESVAVTNLHPPKLDPKLQAMFASVCEMVRRAEKGAE